MYTNMVLINLISLYSLYAVQDSGVIHPTAFYIQERELISWLLHMLGKISRAWYMYLPIYIIIPFHLIYIHRSLYCIIHELNNL